MDKHKRLVVVVIFIMLFSGCGEVESIDKTNISDDIIDDNVIGEISDDNIEESGEDVVQDKEYFSDTYAYMWNSKVCEGEWPLNDDIVKMAIYFRNNRYGEYGREGSDDTLYGYFDFEEKKVYYGMNEKRVDGSAKQQQYELTDDEIKKYKDNLNTSFNYLPWDGHEIWSIAIEYKDGSCYSYQLGVEDCYTNTDEHAMILAFFDKLEITDYERHNYDLDYPLKPGEYANDRDW